MNFEIKIIHEYYENTMNLEIRNQNDTSWLF